MLTRLLLIRARVTTSPDFRGTRLLRGRILHDDVGVVVRNVDSAVSIKDKSLRFDVALARQRLARTCGWVQPNERVNRGLEVDYQHIAIAVWNHVIRHTKAADARRLAAGRDAPDRTPALVRDVDRALVVYSSTDGPHNAGSQQGQGFPIQAHAVHRVLPLHIVDNSICPCERISGWFSPHSTV